MRKATRKPRTPKTQVATAYAGSSIEMYQTVNRWTTRIRPDIELVARALSGTYYSACDLIATVVASMPIRLIREKGTGKAWASRPIRDRKALAWLRGDLKHRPHRKALIAASAADDVEEVLDHPALDRLMDPVPGWLTYQQWAWLITFWQEASGRAFVWYGDGPEPILYPMAPQYTNVVGSKTAMVECYRYGRDSTSPITLPPDQVMYFRQKPHPSDPLGAVSWAHSVTMPSDMENAAFQSEIRRWENGGFPGMMIETEIPASQIVQLRQARSDFDAAYRGVQKAGSTMLLSKGSKVTQAGKPNELGYKDGLAVCRELIYGAAGIPESIWKLNDANRASAVMGDPQFMANKILPILNALADKLTADYLRRFDGTDGMWFAFDNPVAEDRAAVVLEATTLADKGLYTGNQALAAIGAEAGGPELDVYRYNGQPLTMPGGTDEDETTDDPAGGPAEPDDGAAGDTTADAALSERGEAGEQGDNGGAKAGTPAHEGCKCHHGHDHGMKAVGDAERDFARELHGWYTNAVRNSVGQGGVLVSPDTVELQRIIDRGLSAVFRESALRAVAEAGANIGEQIIDAASAAYARTRGAEMLTGVTNTLRNEVRTLIADGFMEGRTIDEIRQSLADAGIAESRTEAIVRTEVSLASQGAARQTFEAAGWEGKYWDVAGGPCPLCEAIGMKYGPSNPIPINQPYFRAGESIVGTDGKVYVFDRDVMDGNSHPNCRCDSVYRETMPEATP